MSGVSLPSVFDSLKAARRGDARLSLAVLGEMGQAVLEAVARECRRRPIQWTGAGTKTYEVLALRTASGPEFSRPLNRDLMHYEPERFTSAWDALIRSLQKSAGTGELSDFDPREVDRAYYSLTAGYGALVDLLGAGNRGGPGAVLEMAVGPAIAILSGRVETGEVLLPIPGSTMVERVKTDLTFAPAGAGHTLAVPTKLSTRERISQAYVHQCILNAARPGEFRSVLVASNENNVMAPRGTPKASRTHDVCWVQDTLVPGTIALYQRYVAKLDGLYYLDPPAPYLSGRYPGLPRVATLGTLLTHDLAGLLA